MTASVLTIVSFGTVTDYVSLGGFITVKKTFLFLPHDLMLNIIGRNLTKPKPQKKKKKKAHVLCMYRFYARDGFYCFWTYYKTSVKHVEC